MDKWMNRDKWIDKFLKEWKNIVSINERSFKWINA